VRLPYYFLVKHHEAFVDRPLVRTVVVQDQIQPPIRPGLLQNLEAVKELGPAFALPNPVGQYPRGQVQRGEQVPRPLGAAVGGAQADRTSKRQPRLALAWPQVQRPELVHADRT
jgi:hypothetical protein